MGAWPLCQVLLLPPSTTGGSEEEEKKGATTSEEAALAQVSAKASRAGLLVRAVSSQQGGGSNSGGVLVLSEGALPLRPQDGWTTRMVPRPAASAAGPAGMQERFRELVWAYSLQHGLSPSQAASAALLWIGGAKVRAERRYGIMMMVV